MKQIKTIDPNLDYTIHLTHDPKSWLPGGETFNGLKVHLGTLAVKDYNSVDVGELKIEGFEKSRVIDFGWSTYGYRFYFNHPKFGQIEIAYGTHANSHFRPSSFDKFYIQSKYVFDISQYDNEKDLENEVEEYILYLKNQIEIFIDNFNKASDPKYISKRIDTNKVIGNLKGKLGGLK